MTEPESVPARMHAVSSASHGSTESERTEHALEHRRHRVDELAGLGKEQDDDEDLVRQEAHCESAFVGLGGGGTCVRELTWTRRPTAFVLAAKPASFRRRLFSSGRSVSPERERTESRQGSARVPRQDPAVLLPRLPDEVPERVDPDEAPIVRRSLAKTDRRAAHVMTRSEEEVRG